MNLRDDKGDVIQLNVPIEAGRNFAEGLELVRIPCTKDYWLVVFECETGFGRFKVDAEGVGKYQLIYPFPLQSYTGRGELDYYDGKLAIAFTFINEVFLIYFEPESGKGEKITGYKLEEFTGIYGLEFSALGSKLYVSDLSSRDIFGNPSGNNLIAIDLSNNSNESNKKGWTITNTNPDCTSQMEGLGQIELGKDGNLYISQINGCQIVVVENPDSEEPEIKKINVSSVLSAGISDHIKSDFLQKEEELHNVIRLEGDPDLCEGEEVVLISELEGSGLQYQWYKNGYLLPDKTGRSITASNPGQYYLEIRGGSECPSTSNVIQLSNATLPEPVVHYQNNVCEGTSAEVLDLPAGTIVSWSNGDSGTATYIQESGVYTVTVSNESCSKSKSFELIVHQKLPLKIPNVITPNEDNKNDSFEIVGLNEAVSLSIYNRWGELVYFSADYHNNWKGENLKNGVYFYKLDLLNICGGSHRGWVSILK